MVFFGDLLPDIPLSAAARAMAASVPIPSWEERTGFLEPALWWGSNVAGIFPLKPANALADGDAAGKLPLLPGPADDPTRRLRAHGDIEAVWMEQPFSNIGMTTGAQGILVLDIDPRNGGAKSMTDYAAHLGIDLADVPRQESPRGDGGVHLMWRLPPGSPRPKYGPLLDGVDIPWQVPVAPSMRCVQVGEDYKDRPIMDYRPYHWIAGDPRKLPTAPDELIAGLAQLGRVNGIRPPRTAKPGQRHGPVPIDVAKLIETGIPRGRQNNTIQALATSMAGRGVPFADAVATIWQILQVSPQDHRDRWTRNQLSGDRGIVTRAYEFIAKDRRQKYEQHRAWAANLRASSRPRG